MLSTAININITYILFLGTETKEERKKKNKIFSPNNIVMHRTTHDMFWTERRVCSEECERTSERKGGSVRLLNFPFNASFSKCEEENNPKNYNNGMKCLQNRGHWRRSFGNKSISYANAWTKCIFLKKRRVKKVYFLFENCLGPVRYVKYLPIVA